jgi:hypothetical protein
VSQPKVTGHAPWKKYYRKLRNIEKLPAKNHYMIITVRELSQRFTIGKLQLKNYRCVTAESDWSCTIEKIPLKSSQHQKNP